MTTEYLITGQLVLDTALHIGMGKGGEPTDAPLRRANDGRLLIPGRALAGSLRTLASRLAPRLGLSPLCEALLSPTALQTKREAELKARRVTSPNVEGKLPCACPVCQLFGDINPVDNVRQKEGQEIESRASCLWVYDAFAAASTPTSVRDGVGIDRQSGTAARHAKFDYEVVPAGTKFALRLRVKRLSLEDNDGQATASAKLLAVTLAEWAAGHGQLGGNVARGLGQFRLEEVSCQKLNLTDDTLLDYLLDQNAATYHLDKTEWWQQIVDDIKLNQLQVRTVSGDDSSPVASCFVRLDLTLTFADLFLTNDPQTALISGFDHAPLVDVITKPKDGIGQPILSGSSLRGVWRSHAEKIVRTLATDYWWRESGQDAAKAEELFRHNCPACNVLVSIKAKKLASCDARLVIPDTKETPAEALCLSCRLFGSQRRGSRLWVRDGRLTQPALTADSWQAQDFLAIDRFTGGGLHGAKFDAAPLVGAQFQTELLLHDPAEWELGWLVLVLRDLADGLVTVGFGAAKGYGRIHAAACDWTVGYITPDDVTPLQLDQELLSNGEREGLFTCSTMKGESWLPSAWRDVANGWVAQFNQMVTGFAPQESEDGWQSFAADTFFGQEAFSLYGPSRTEVTEVKYDE